MTDLKERLLDGDIFSYSWLPTKIMWVDMMTKEMELPSALELVFLENEMNLPKPLVNELKAIWTEIRMDNIRNG